MGRARIGERDGQCFPSGRAAVVLTGARASRRGETLTHSTDHATVYSARPRSCSAMSSASSRSLAAFSCTMPTETPPFPSRTATFASALERPWLAASRQFCRKAQTTLSVTALREHFRTDSERRVSSSPSWADSSMLRLAGAVDRLDNFDQIESQNLRTSGRRLDG